MARTKDFSDVNTGRLYGTIEAATAEPEQEAPAAQEAEQEQAATAAEEVQEEAKKNRPRKEYTAQERLDFMQEMRTAGRKGVKLPRINLAFAPDVYEYIQIMSRVRGESMTDFVNIALRQHIEDHRDLYDKAIEFRNSL